MKKKAYIAPEIDVCTIYVEMQVSSQNTMPRNNSSITSSDEILTKERSIFDEDRSFFGDVW